MENAVQIVVVPIITALVYGAVEIYKIIVNGREKFLRFIPVVATLLGVLIGVVSYCCIPNVVPSDNILTAILVGGASGLAATGTHQMFKQIAKPKEQADVEEASVNKQDKG